MPGISARLARLKTAILPILAVLSASCSLDIMPPPEPEVPRTLISHSEFRLPAGSGPFPAVVLMHGCSGLEPSVRRQLNAHAQMFREAGFATLILDSFGPRNLSGGEVCRSDSALERARQYRLLDAHHALDYLAARSDIQGSRVFLLGQSNGGSTGIRIAQTRAGDRAFRGVAAYYPWCGGFTSAPVVTPLLILSGRDDRWTPPERCLREAQRRRPGQPVEVVVYDGAVHSFDLMIPVRPYMGYPSGGHPEARAESMRRVLNFFQALAR